MTPNTRAYHSRYNKERYAKRKADGVCVYCGANLPTIHNTFSCQECGDKMRQRSSHQRLKNKLKIIGGLVNG